FGPVGTHAGGNDRRLRGTRQAQRRGFFRVTRCIMKTVRARAGSKRQALFDQREFAQALQASTSIIACFKACIRAARAQLDQRFLAGEKAEVLINDASWFTDQILINVWCRYSMGKAN